MSTSMMAASEIFGPEDEAILEELDVPRYNRESVYGHPCYQPVRVEHSRVPVRVRGTLPSDLEGVYIRNGSNVQFDKPTVRAHIFNGAGMLHVVQISAGSAHYSNTYIRTPRFLFEERIGREVFPSSGDFFSSGLAGAKRMKLLARKQAAGLVPNWSALEANSASTSIQVHHGRLYCLQGTGLPFMLNAKIEKGALLLDGTGQIQTWDGRLQVPFSAHPGIDPVSGDFYSVSVDSRSRSLWLTHLRHGMLVNSVNVHQFVDAADIPGIIHDCFLTENFIVVADVSLRFSESNLLDGGPSLWRFNPEYNLRWGVIPRKFSTGDRVRWFECAKPAMLWHAVNGWEEEGVHGGRQIVLYAPAFDDYPPTVPIHTPEEPPARLTRWVLDLDSGKVVEETRVLEHGYERPSINRAWFGKKNRYAYLIDEEGEGYMGKGVLKYDLQAHEELAYVDYGGFYGGEALFVPRQGAVQEDDGYLLELLVSPTNAELLVLDARSMQELARLELPARVPFGVHACWVTPRDLSALAR
jgi:carotenoid cleavage dioxygenase